MTKAKIHNKFVAHWLVQLNCKQGTKYFTFKKINAKKNLLTAKKISSEQIYYVVTLSFVMIKKTLLQTKNFL